jgi:hypothetical protein
MPNDSSINSSTQAGAKRAIENDATDAPNKRLQTHRRGASAETAPLTPVPDLDTDAAVQAVPHTARSPNRTLEQSSDYGFDLSDEEINGINSLVTAIEDRQTALEADEQLLREFNERLQASAEHSQHTSAQDAEYDTDFDPAEIAEIDAFLDQQTAREAEIQLLGELAESRHASTENPDETHERDTDYGSDFDADELDAALVEAGHEPISSSDDSEWEVVSPKTVQEGFVVNRTGMTVTENELDDHVVDALKANGAWPLDLRTARFELETRREVQLSTEEPSLARDRRKMPYPFHGFDRIGNRWRGGPIRPYEPTSSSEDTLLILDVHSLEKPRPQFVTPEEYKGVYDCTPTPYENSSLLIKHEEKRPENDDTIDPHWCWPKPPSTYRPQDPEGWKTSGCAGMKMMIRDECGNFLWIRPERESFNSLTHWIAEYGDGNVWLNDGRGNFLIPAVYNARLDTRTMAQKRARPKNLAVDAFDVFRGQPGRNDIPQILIQNSRHEFVGIKRFASEARQQWEQANPDWRTEPPAEAASARADFLTAQLAKRNFWVQTPTGDSYFCPSTWQLHNKAYLDEVLRRHKLTPALLTKPNINADDVPSILVKTSAETFITGEAAAQLANAEGLKLRQIFSDTDILVRRPKTRHYGGNFSNPDYFLEVDYADMPQLTLQLLDARQNSSGKIEFNDLDNGQGTARQNSATDPGRGLSERPRGPGYGR